MRRLKKQNPIKRQLLKMLIIPGVVFIVLLMTSIGRQMIRIHAINREIKVIEGEIAKMERTNSQVLKNLDYYKTLSFMEREARTKIGMKKAGEEVAVFLNTPEELNQNPFKSELSNKEWVSNPRKWFYYFFRKDLL